RRPRAGRALRHVHAGGRPPHDGRHLHDEILIARPAARARGWVCPAHRPLFAELGGVDDAGSGGRVKWNSESGTRVLVLMSANVRSFRFPCPSVMTLSRTSKLLGSTTKRMFFTCGSATLGDSDKR